MTLSVRERNIAVAAGAAVLGFLLYSFALTPYLDARAQLETDVAAQKKATDAADRLLRNRPQVEKEWKALTESGLKQSPAEGDSQALHALQNWAQEARVDIQSLTNRATRIGDFQELRFTVGGTGSTATIARFLWKVERADFPLHVNAFHVNARKDGTDDLEMQLTVSTIVFSPQPPKGLVPPGAKGAIP